MDWFGRARVKFTHHASPLRLRAQGGGETDLLRLCERSTPPCQLNPLLFNGHLQTMWTAAAKGAPAIHYRRHVLASDHANYVGTFAVDFAVAPHADHDEGLPPRTAYFPGGEGEGEGRAGSFDASMRGDDARPMLVVLHGLSGGSYEVYLRHAIAPLLLGDDGTVGSGGWECCVVNARGCANSEVTSGVLFNARATWDIRQVVRMLRERFPNRPLFGLGFSLGANILTNVRGFCVFACSPPPSPLVCPVPCDVQCWGHQTLGGGGRVVDAIR